MQNTIRMIALLACVALWFMPRPATAQEFKPIQAAIDLEDGDTVVFLGDSITHQCLYTQYIEDYYYTRYPQKRIHFHNSGVGGDTAADALARFDDDVAAFKPKYVSILLGMNDGRYTHFDHEIFATYERDMTTLLNRLAAIDANAVPAGPTMFDTRAIEINPRRKSSELRDHYYNAVLAFYGTWLQQQAFDRGLGFVDMFSRLNQLTVAQRKIDPKFTMIPDAVHPGPAGHVVMAYALLEDMQATRGVSSINAVRRGGKWTVGGTGGKAGALESTEGGLKFTFQANSLPWVVPEEAALGYQLTKAGHKMSNERIRVFGLDPGKYELVIDDQVVGTYTNLQLGAKVELQANTKTPEYQQAMKVALLNKERNEKAVHPLRDAWRDMKVQRRKLDSWITQHPDDTEGAAQRRHDLETWKVPFGQRIEKLLGQVRQYEDQIYAANQPALRQIEVRRAD